MTEALSQAYAFLAKGGPLMIPILLASLLAGFIFVERFFYLRQQRRQAEALSERLQLALQTRDIEALNTAAQTQNSVLAELLQAALKHQSRERMQEALQEKAKRSLTKLERGLPSLSTIASISPLLGLLGTVTGMIQVFSGLAEAFIEGTQANQALLAQGIWEALITTAAGLSVAIPAYLLHRILCSQLEKLQDLLDECTEQILNQLSSDELPKHAGA